MTCSAGVEVPQISHCLGPCLLHLVWFTVCVCVCLSYVMCVFHVCRLRYTSSPHPTSTRHWSNILWFWPVLRLWLRCAHRSSHRWRRLRQHCTHTTRLRQRERVRQLRAGAAGRRRRRVRQQRLRRGRGADTAGDQWLWCVWRRCCGCGWWCLWSKQWLRSTCGAHSTCYRYAAGPALRSVGQIITRTALSSSWA